MKIYAVGDIHGAYKALMQWVDSTVPTYPSIHLLPGVRIERLNKRIFYGKLLPQPW